jgi:hypothetical protein
MMSIRGEAPSCVKANPFSVNLGIRLRAETAALARWEALTDIQRKFFFITLYGDVVMSRSAEETV